MSIDLVRNRPVFDTEEIQLGSAIKIKDTKSYYQKNRDWRDALIVSVKLNELVVVVFDGEDDVEKIEIEISEVLDKTYEIKTLGAYYEVKKTNN